MISFYINIHKNWVPFIRRSDFLIMNKIQLKKLWKSRNIILEVLTDRGYPVKDSDYISDDVYKKWRSEVGVTSEEKIKDSLKLFFKTSDKCEGIKVYWSKLPKFGPEIINIKNDLDKDNIKKTIIIINKEVTTHGNKSLRNLKIQGYYIDIYPLNEIQYNIMKHRFVPKQTLCTPKEKKELLSSYSITHSQLPQIKFGDPVVRHLGAKRGQVIKIERESDTQIGYKTLYYRLIT